MTERKRAPYCPSCLALRENGRCPGGCDDHEVLARALRAVAVSVALLAAVGCTRRITGPDVCVEQTVHWHAEEVRPHFLKAVTDSITYIDVECGS